jgi:hypothetical protein
LTGLQTNIDSIIPETPAMPPKERREAPFQLSPEQLALQAARRELKAKKEAAKLAGSVDEQRAGDGRQQAILKRDWAPITQALGQSADVSSYAQENALTIMTWNVSTSLAVERTGYSPNSYRSWLNPSSVCIGVKRSPFDELTRSSIRTRVVSGKRCPKS